MLQAVAEFPDWEEVREPNKCWGVSFKLQQLMVSLCIASFPSDNPSSSIIIELSIETVYRFSIIDASRGTW